MTPDLRPRLPADSKAPSRSPQATAATPGLASSDGHTKERTLIHPGSVSDWLQASLMAGVLGGLAAAGRWALRTEEAEQATPHVVPLRESTGTTTPPRQSARQADPVPDENPEAYRPCPPPARPFDGQPVACDLVGRPGTRWRTASRIPGRRRPPALPPETRDSASDADCGRWFPRGAIRTYGAKRDGSQSATSSKSWVSVTWPPAAQRIGPCRCPPGPSCWSPGRT
jgi:hypothetical protein